MLWIAAIVAVCIVASIVKHAVQDSRYADAQRLEALAEIESRSHATPSGATPEVTPSNGAAPGGGAREFAPRPSVDRGLVPPPGGGDVSTVRPPEGMRAS
ncbi:MAG: hypothetical protein ACJ79S_14435 [Gemmatimonadaceae bacterium]